MTKSLLGFAVRAKSAIVGWLSSYCLVADYIGARVFYSDVSVLSHLKMFRHDQRDIPFVILTGCGNVGCVLVRYQTCEREQFI